MTKTTAYRSKPGKQKAVTRGNKIRFQGKCFQCGKFGHRATECWHKSDKKEEKHTNSNETAMVRLIVKKGTRVGSCKFKLLCRMTAEQAEEKLTKEIAICYRC